MGLKPTFFIKNNEDWSNLKENEELVEILNDSYFGFRAMEKNAKSIIYDPCIVNSLVRIGKESKKFPNTKHILLFDIETLSYESRNSEEEFLKQASRVIEELLELNPEVKLDFEIKCGGLDSIIIKDTLMKIYKK